MNVQEIMTRPVVTCRPTDSLHFAAKLMWEHDCGAIPVIDDTGKLVGIVTDRDICMATYTQGKAPQAIAVTEAMAKQVFSGRFNDSLESLERLMSDKQIRRIPIVDGNQRPIGIVSMNDIARYTASASKKGNLEHMFARTLAAICRPHTAIQAISMRALAKRQPEGSPEEESSRASAPRS